MLTNESIQQAFSLAHSLHPHRVVAWEITREALKQCKVRGSTQGARPTSHRPYKQKLDEINLLRSSVFTVSEKWEKDQESRSPKREPVYTPTTEDLLYRYLKTLVWHSMDRDSIYAAVAIGTHLFTYQTSEIAAVSVDCFDSENIRRVKSWFSKKIESRFSDIMVITNDPGGRSASRPTDYQLAFVNRSLSKLAPQISGHPGSCNTDGMLLNEFFSYDSTRIEPERVHIIMNTECGGWARLVNEYNRFRCSFSSMQLDDPADKLRLPIVNDGFDGPQKGSESDDAPSVLEDRFEPEPLNSVEVRSLVQQVEHPPMSGLGRDWDIAA